MMNLTCKITKDGGRFMRMKKGRKMTAALLVSLMLLTAFLPAGALQVRAAEVIATVYGTVLSGTTEDVLLLSTAQGRMEIKLDSNTDASACKVLFPGREIYVRSYYDYPWDSILRFVGYKNGIGNIKFSDFLGGIPKLAGGGILTPGQLFMANENGPELLGRIGNRTTVMGNDQIVKSVSNGVESAMTNQVTRLEALMRQMIENQERIIQKDLSLNIDGKRANRQLSKARKNAGYSFSPA